MTDFDEVRKFANQVGGKHHNPLHDRGMLVTLTEIATSLKNLEKILSSVVIDGRLNVKLPQDSD
jgi:hypothetical protein